MHLDEAQPGARYRVELHDCCAWATFTAVLVSKEATVDGTEDVVFDNGVTVNGMAVQCTPVDDQPPSGRTAVKIYLPPGTLSDFDDIAEKRPDWDIQGIIEHPYLDGHTPVVTTDLDADPVDVFKSVFRENSEPV